MPFAPILLALAAAATAPSAPDYAALVCQLATGSTAIDYARFRDLAVAQPGFDPDFDPSAIAAARKAGDQPAVRRLSETRLAGDYADMAAHYWLSEACAALKDRPCADRHGAIFNGLLAAIRASGDGQGAASAYKVHRLAEEYILIGTRRLTSTGQQTLSQNGRRYDVLRVTDGKGAASDIWFDVTAFAPEAAN